MNAEEALKKAREKKELLAKESFEQEMAYHEDRLAEAIELGKDFYIAYDESYLPRDVLYSDLVIKRLKELGFGVSKTSIKVHVHPYDEKFVGRYQVTWYEKYYPSSYYQDMNPPSQTNNPPSQENKTFFQDLIDFFFKF